MSKMRLRIKKFNRGSSFVVCFIVYHDIPFCISNTGEDVMNFEIDASREEFDHALKQVKKANKGKKPFDLVLEFDGASLLLDTPLVTLPVSATGSADVKIGLPGQVMVRMQGTFPSVESLHFSLNGASLKIDRLTMPCTIIR